MDHQIDDLFFSFNQQSDKVRGYLSEILEVVKAGKVPSLELTTDLFDSISDLNERYDFVYNTAKKLVSEDELPAHGDALEEVVLAVKDSQSKHIAEQLTSAKNILNKFIRVKSIVQEYTQALSSYQKEAELLLKEINEDTIEELYEETEAPALFLDAMENENIHSPEGFNLMEKVEDHYPNKYIQYGLISHMFYCDDFNDNEDQNLTVDSDISLKSKEVSSNNEKVIIIDQANDQNESGKPNNNFKENANTEITLTEEAGGEAELTDDKVDTHEEEPVESDDFDEAGGTVKLESEEEKIERVPDHKSRESSAEKISSSEQLSKEDTSVHKTDETIVELFSETKGKELNGVLNELDIEKEQFISHTIEDETDLSVEIVNVSKKETRCISDKVDESEEEPIIDQTSEVKILTARELLDLGRTPNDEEFCGLIHSLLNQTPVDDEDLTALIVQASLLAEGAGLEGECPLASSLSTRLQLATNILRTENDYTFSNLANSFSTVEPEVQAMALAAYMLALINPGTAYRDYALESQTKIYLSDFDSYFPELRSFKELFNALIKVPEISTTGFTPAIIALLGDKDEKERFTEKLKNQAQEHLVASPPKARIKDLPGMYAIAFGEKSDLHDCMEIISNGNDEDLELVEDVLNDFCDEKDGVFSINDNKIEEQLDKAWDKANQKNKFDLSYAARQQAIKQYKIRLDIMHAWTESIRDQKKNQKNLEKLKNLRKDILDIIDIIKMDQSWIKVEDANVLRWLLYYIPAYLNENISEIDIYKDLLTTGVFSLSVEGIPEIDASFNGIKYYEIWRNALRHIVAPRRSVEEVTDEILGNVDTGKSGDKSLMDNLRQLSMIGKLLGSDDEKYVVNEQQIIEGTDFANKSAQKFEENLELAYTYSRINETEKENLFSIMIKYKSGFYEIGDFACWRRFLDALKEQIQDFARIRREVLDSRLQDLIRNDHSSPILEETKKMMKNSNFAVVEEYLNRYGAGERELNVLTIADKDYFGTFLSGEVFEPLLKECKRSKGSSLKKFGRAYIEKNFPKDWTNRYREDSKSLISTWPTRRDSATSTQVVSLFKRLGFSVTNATKVNGSKEERWRIEATPSAKREPDYLHPIAIFGTQMKSPFNAIFLYGTHTEQAIVDTITSMNLGGMSIVLIDRPIDRAERRQIGEIFHTQKSGQNPFLLIDQVLFLYLSLLQGTERLPALLKCTIPYATYQPFVRDAGSTADEMFCGRQQELATIIDRNGACIVYGGRQLGKTALLQRAESRCSNPENKEFAILSSIINLKTEKEVANRLVEDINNKTGKKVKLNSCVTIREMCNQLNEMFRNGQIVSMHLFVDEADDFLGAISDDAYKSIQPLVDLRRETKNNFKFVIAGLHNVCRAENATKNNGIFGQLGAPLCIKPLSPRDAYQLLAKPLLYLGFQIEDPRNLEIILTKTNYYPGILQFFGYILVETLSGQYSKYYSAANGNPPFPLLGEQLGAVMSSSDLNNSIKEKFRWSLELDPRYFMIARCITMLYHFDEDDRSSGSWRGFSVDKIIEMANSYPIHCLEKMSKKEYIVLLDEMVEMGILGKSDYKKDIYRLRRNSFIDIVGKDIDVLDEEINSNNV